MKRQRKLWNCYQRRNMIPLLITLTQNKATEIREKREEEGLEIFYLFIYFYVSWSLKE